MKVTIKWNDGAGFATYKHFVYLPKASKRTRINARKAGLSSVNKRTFVKMLR